MTSPGLELSRLTAAERPNGQLEFKSLVWMRCAAIRGHYKPLSLLSAHPDLDYPRIVFDQLTHRLPPKTPQFSQFPDSVVPFESGVISRHWNKQCPYIKEMAEAIPDKLYCTLFASA